MIGRKAAHREKPSCELVREVVRGLVRARLRVHEDRPGLPVRRGRVVVERVVREKDDLLSGLCVA